MWLALAAAVVFSDGLAAQAPTGGGVGPVLTGMVRSRFGGGVRPLAHAVVEVQRGHEVQTVVADSVGRYVIEGLEAGEVRLRVAHLGHEPMTLTVKVPARGDIVVDLELAAIPVEIVGLDVEADLREPADVSVAEPDEPGLGTDPELEVRMLELSPSLVEAGMVDAIQALPGNDPADPTDVLFMRGSTTELKLVLLDGVPVFAPFHVGGVMHSFEPATLGSARFHVGGAPARYDGGLTHILDLRTRSARRDRTRASGAIDLLSASAALESPIGDRAGLLVSARSLHDLGRAPLGGERPYGYEDVLVTLEADPAPGHRLRATGFWNAETVRLDYAAAPADASWGNEAAGVTYEAAVGSADIQMTLGASRYDAVLPLRPTPTERDPEPEEILASGRNERVRLVVESAWSERAMPIRLGLSFEDQRAAFSAETLRGSSRTAAGGTRSVVGSFLDATRSLGPGVTLRAGLRADVFDGEAPRFSPRASMVWEVGPAALLTVAAGRYHQVTRTPTTAEVDLNLEAFANQAVGATELLAVASADHVVLTLDQRLGQAVSMGLGGYFKRYEGLHAAGGSVVRNSGIDLQILSSGDRATVWLGYGLSWFWSARDLSGRADDFVGRHLLSAGASGALAGPLRAEARIAYGAGLPSTGIPFGSVHDEAASAPEADPVPGTALSAASATDAFALDESFLRLDLELQALFEPEWGGRPWRVRPYLRLLNALDRRDALFYAYQPWRSQQVMPLAERPVLPLLGVAFSF